MTVDYIFRSDDRAGHVDAQGNFTAGTRAGTYESGVTVEVVQGPVTKSATVRVSVVPGPLHRVDIEPAKQDIEVTKAQRFTAGAMDRYGNPIADLDYTYQSDELAGRVDSQGNFTAGTRTGAYQGAVTVKVSQGAVTKTASAEVMIEPGPLHRVNIEPVEPNIEVTKGRQFTFTTLDRFDNPILGLPFTFRSGEQVGRIDNLGKFTAGTRAGTYDGAVTVEVREGTKTVTAVTAVTIRHGPLERVLLSPGTATLDISDSLKFSVQAVDAYDNPILDARLTWDAEETVGVLTDDGILTAGTLADTFGQGVKVTAILGSVSAGAAASVTVNPGPLHSVSIPPLVEVAAGINQQLDAIARDKYGNLLDDVEVTWTMTNSDAGSITPSGHLTAGEIAGRFQGVIGARATQGDLTSSAASSVTIIPGPLEQVVIAPNPANIGMGMTQQFVAVGADRFGNRVSGLAPTWSVRGGGGAMDANGLFTAGTDPGSYTRTVKAVATQNGITRSASANVTVEPDRIVFESDRKDDQFDIYVMNGDGTDVARRTSSGASGPRWSPDGRRILYDSSGRIFLMTDDGTWKFTIVSETYDVFQADWSSDGAKIVFHCHPEDKHELCVADVDGGNVTQLTSNSADDSRPAWSPDGQLIAFVSDRDGNEEIYVMDSDGSNETRLTIAGGSDIQGVDSEPSWSPDGREILFQSGRSGIEWGIYLMNPDGTNVRQLTPAAAFSSNCPSWSPDGERIVFHSLRDSDKAEIYIMDREGGNVRRLTNDSAIDLCPRWAPRKRGVEVSVASVVIPNTSFLRPFTVQEVTANARGAVVRVETDLGSGSGFIIDPDGLILTNNHVVRDANEITVHLDDGTSYTGRVHGRDLVRDIALLNIEATGLPTLELGDLSRVSLGQRVVVLGYPLGLQNFSVTGGFVSTTARDTGRNVIWVQTDSAVNPGNSGGPLITLQGKVIGVVAAKFVSLAIEGVGFAISSNTIGLYLERLKAGEVIF